MLITTDISNWSETLIALVHAKSDRFSAALCVSLRSLRLITSSTQRPQRYAESRGEDIQSTPLKLLKVRMGRCFQGRARTVRRKMPRATRFIDSVLNSLRVWFLIRRHPIS